MTSWCVSCHGAKGEGKRRHPRARRTGYENYLVVHLHGIGPSKPPILHLLPTGAVGLTVAILFTDVKISHRLGQVERAEEDLGLPLSKSATGPESHEAVLEANYKAVIYRGVSLQPDFQYVFRPNGQANIHDAAVIGARANVEF